MKKIAFMFVAAALFAACGGNQKPAEEPVETVEVEAPVEVVLTAEDSAAVAAMFEGQEVSDSVLQAAYDSILAAKSTVEDVVEEAVEEVAE